MGPGGRCLLNRLPTAFEPAGRKGGERLIGAIGELADRWGRTTRSSFSPRAPTSLPAARFGRFANCARSADPIWQSGRELQHTLPPRTTGVQTALASAPENADVFFIGHAGLEAFESAGDIWRGMPMDTVVAARTWLVQQMTSLLPSAKKPGSMTPGLKSTNGSSPP